MTDADFINAATDPAGADMDRKTAERMMAGRTFAMAVQDLRASVTGSDVAFVEWLFGDGHPLLLAAWGKRQAERNAEARRALKSENEASAARQP